MNISFCPLQRFRCSLNFIIFSIFFLTSPLILNAQEKIGDLSNREKIISTAKEIMTAARYCALITIDSTRQPHVRTMDPFPPDTNMVIWFGTNSKSRKVKEILNNPNVTLYYPEPKQDGYVVIKGIAEIINDKMEKEMYWKKEWEAFYPGKEANYILIKVTPVQLDILSYKHGLIGNPYTWRIPSIKF